MMPAMNDEREQEQLWDTVKVLTNIDKEKAETVLKTTIEKSLRLMDIHAPIISRLHFNIPDDRYLSRLKELNACISKQIAMDITENTYEQVLDYIDLVSDITEKPAQTSKQLLASILAENARKVHSDTNSVQPIVSIEREENHYYKPNEVAKKLGLSDQTIRRMCEKGKFKEAFRTEGGHWRIPEDNFITSPKQDKQAKEFFEHIDRKNGEVGDVDEFDL